MLLENDVGSPETDNSELRFIMVTNFIMLQQSKLHGLRLASYYQYDSQCILQ